MTYLHGQLWKSTYWIILIFCWFGYFYLAAGNNLQVDQLWHDLKVIIWVARAKFWHRSWSSTRPNQTICTASRISTFGATNWKTCSLSRGCRTSKSSRSVSTKSAPLEISPGATSSKYFSIHSGTVLTQELHYRFKRNSTSDQVANTQSALAAR